NHRAAGDGNDFALERSENIEHPTSNFERRNEQRFALPFDVRRWMFDVGRSSGIMESTIPESRVETMNRWESPSTALRAPSPPLGEKDGMRGLQFTLSFFACIGTMNGGDSVEAARPSPNTPSV